MKKRDDNRYQKTMRYKDETGRIKRKVLYGRTLGELDAAILEFKKQREQGQRIEDGKCSVREWAEKWLEAYKRGRVSAKTLEGYERDISIIMNAIGWKQLREIEYTEVRNFAQGEEEWASHRDSATMDVA